MFTVENSSSSRRERERGSEEENVAGKGDGGRGRDDEGVVDFWEEKIAKPLTQMAHSSSHRRHTQSHTMKCRGERMQRAVGRRRGDGTRNMT